jgi:D-glycero-D-manno-heptose 1,7-bisphosphate phosphatase
MKINSTYGAVKPNQLTTPAIFLDRDGTINVEKKYLYRIEDWEWVPRAPEAIRQLNQAGFKVVVVSNQAGIARGMYNHADVDNLHLYVSSELKKIGARIDAFYYCPHHPKYSAEHDCYCRKPSPGLLIRAADELAIDLSRSWIIGDKLIDMEAGQAMGLNSILVLTGYGDQEKSLATHGQIIAENLPLACQYILNHQVRHVLDEAR